LIIGGLRKKGNLLITRKKKFRIWNPDSEPERRKLPKETWAVKELRGAMGCGERGRQERKTYFGAGGKAFRKGVRKRKGGLADVKRAVVLPCQRRTLRGTRIPREFL